jgi:hypothetical protein
MRSELEQAGSDVKEFERFMPPLAAQRYAEAEDAEDFYSGPGTVEQGDVTWRMARILLQDFFDEADAIERAAPPSGQAAFHPRRDRDPAGYVAGPAGRVSAGSRARAR